MSENDNRFIDPCEADDLGGVKPPPTTRQGLVKSLLADRLAELNINPNSIITDIELPPQGSTDPGPTVDEFDIPPVGAGSGDDPVGAPPRTPDSIPSINNPDDLDMDNLAAQGLHGWFSSFGRRNWFFYNPSRHGIRGGGAGTLANAYIPNKYTSASPLASYADFNFGTGDYSAVGIVQDEQFGAVARSEYITTTINTVEESYTYERPASSVMRYTYNHHHYLKDYGLINRGAHLTNLGGTLRGMGNPLHSPGYFRTTKTDSFRYISGKHYSYFPGGDGVKSEFESRNVADASYGLKHVMGQINENLVRAYAAEVREDNPEEDAERVFATPHFFHIPKGVQWVNSDDQIIPNARSRSHNGLMGSIPAPFNSRSRNRKDAGLVMEYGWKPEYYDYGHIACPQAPADADVPGLFIRGIDPNTGVESLAWWLSEWRHENLLLNDTDNWTDNFDTAARKELMCIKCYPHNNAAEDLHYGNNPFGRGSIHRVIRMVQILSNREYDSSIEDFRTSFIKTFAASEISNMSLYDVGDSTFIYSSSPNPMHTIANPINLEDSDPGGLELSEDIIKEYNTDAAVIEKLDRVQVGDASDESDLKQDTRELLSFYENIDYNPGIPAAALHGDPVGTFITYMRSGWSWKNYFYGLYPTLSKRWYHIRSLREFITKKATKLSRRSENYKEETNRHPSDLAMMHGYRHESDERLKNGFSGYQRGLSSRYAGNLPPLVLDFDGNEIGNIVDESLALTDTNIRDACVLHFTDFKHGTKERFSENMFPIIPFYGPEYYPDEVTATGRQARNIGFTAQKYTRADGAGDFLEARDRDLVYKWNADNDCMAKRYLEGERDNGNMPQNIVDLIFGEADGLEADLLPLSTFTDGLMFHPHIWEMIYDIYVRTRLNADQFGDEFLPLLAAVNVMARRIGDNGQPAEPGLSNPFLNSGYSYGVGSEIQQGTNYSTDLTPHLNKYVKEFNPFLSTRVRPPTVGPAVYIDLTTSIEGFAKKDDIEKVDFGINSYFYAKGEYEYYDQSWENTLALDKDHRELTNLYQHHPTGYSIVGGSIQKGGMDHDLSRVVGRSRPGSTRREKLLKRHENRLKRSPHLLPPEPTAEVEKYNSFVLQDKRYSEKYKLRKSLPMYIDIEFKPKARSKVSDFLQIGTTSGVDYSEVIFDTLEEADIYTRQDQSRAQGGQGYGVFNTSTTNYNMHGNYSITVDSIMYYDISNKAESGWLSQNYTEEEYAEMMYQTRERFRIETLAAGSMEVGTEFYEEYDQYRLAGEGSAVGEAFNNRFDSIGYEFNRNEYGTVPGYRLTSLIRPTQNMKRTPMVSLEEWLSSLENDAERADTVEERLSKIFGQMVLTSNISQFVGDKFRSYKDIMNGKPAHSEIIGYKVKKMLRGVDGTYTHIQTKYFSQTPTSEIIRHFDSQVKYGEIYKLEIYSVCMIVGNKYAYLDPMTSKGVKDFNEIAGRISGKKEESYYTAAKAHEVDPGQLQNRRMAYLQQAQTTFFLDAVIAGITELRDLPTFGDFPSDRNFEGDLIGARPIINRQRLYKPAEHDYNRQEDHARMYVGIYNKPHVAITEVFDRCVSVAIADKPPVPPNVEIISYKGIKTVVTFRLNGSTGEMHAKPIMLDDDDIDQYRITAANQGISPIHIKDTGYDNESPAEDCLIHFKNDDEVDVFEVFRSNTEPKSWQDFRGKKVARITNGTTAATYVDTEIVPNRKYWYTFRGEDIHGHVSMPSNIYQIEMVSDGEMHYLKQDLFTFRKPKKKTKKSLKRLMKISPSMLQKSFDVRGASEREWNYEAWSASGKSIGVSRNPIWDKKFLIKIKSKDTGRQVDLRLKFNRKHGNVDEEGKVTVEKI